MINRKRIIDSKAEKLINIVMQAADNRMTGRSQQKPLASRLRQYSFIVFFCHGFCPYIIILLVMINSLSVGTLKCNFT